MKPAPRSRAGVKKGRSKRLSQTPINLHGKMYHIQMQHNLHVYLEDDSKTCTEALLSTYQTKRCHNPKHHNAKPTIHRFMLSCFPSPHKQMEYNLHVYPEDDGKTCTEALLSTYQTKWCHSPKGHNAKSTIHRFMLSCCPSPRLQF